MYFSGISDEAGKTIDRQIAAHRELGWSYLELRTVNGVNLTRLPDDEFDQVYRAVSEAGMRVSCFASAIANWARPITCDPEIDRQDLARAIPRMHRFGTRFIRVMSYPNDPEKPVPEDEWRREAIARRSGSSGARCGVYTLIMYDRRQPLPGVTHDLSQRRA